MLQAVFFQHLTLTFFFSFLLRSSPPFYRSTRTESSVEPGEKCVAVQVNIYISNIYVFGSITRVVRFVARTKNFGVCTVVVVGAAAVFHRFHSLASHLWARFLFSKRSAHV